MTKLKIINYKHLSFYKDAEELVTLLYKVTDEFPKDERYNMTQQLRRAVVSITSNIAEGAGNGYVYKCCQFFKIALGSAKEIESQIRVCRNLNYITHSTYREIQELLDKIIGKITNYVKQIQKVEDRMI